MPKPMTTARKVSSSRKRVSKIADARATLSEFDKGVELDVLTFGQFSIIDAIEAVLEKTGPADVALATWTAAGFDLSQIERQVKYSQIRDLRMIVDRSFVSRQPKFVEAIHRMFGRNAVRSTRTHAKFVVVTNAEWSVVIRTSANLNENARLEFIQVSDDPSLAEFYLRVVDAIYAEEDPGLENLRSVPMLNEIEGVPALSPVAMGDRPSTGVPPRMR